MHVCVCVFSIDGANRLANAKTSVSVRQNTKTFRRRPNLGEAENAKINLCGKPSRETRKPSPESKKSLIQSGGQQNG